MPDVIQPAKHGRDHCLGGVDPIPCLERPWARLGAGGGTAPNDTWTPCDFSQAMRDPIADANDIFTLTDVGGTRFRIDLTNPGMYLVQLIVSWTNSFAEYRAINCNNGATVDDQLYGEGYGLTLGKGPFPSTGGPYFNIDSLTGYFFASESVSPYRLDPWVYQSSGVDRSFDALSLRVVYLGTIRPEASWEFLP